MPGIPPAGFAFGYLLTEDLTAHGHFQQSHQPGGIRHRLRSHLGAMRPRALTQSLLSVGLRYTVPLRRQARQNFVSGTPVSHQTLLVLPSFRRFLVRRPAKRWQGIESRARLTRWNPVRLFL